jgi:modulator of FtsH protease HflK
LSDPHQHPFDDLMHDHGHADHAPAVTEEPLDPANQSLADALRASFRVLKIVMFVVAILFICSGMVRVDNKEVVVKTRFGKTVDQPLQPGLHWAWPYPIEATVRVPTASRKMYVDAFWLKLSDAEKSKNLDELSARSGGLDPGVDGALLTGDRAIMHLLLQVQYKVTDATAFVKNVRDTEQLLNTVIQECSVAETARSTVDIVWKDPASLAGLIQKRAQQKLNSLDSGITLDNVAAEKSHYPLQVKDDFLAVQDAENRMRSAIQEANKVWEEKVKGAAGPAWEPLRKLIGQLDTADAGQRDEILRQIDKTLTEQAQGEASARIQRARAESDKIVADTVAEVQRFRALLVEYHKHPDLVRERLTQDMMAEIFSKPGVSRWVLPKGNRNIWLNKDPLEIRQREIEDITKKAEQGGK